MSDLLARRQAVIGPDARLFYDDPVEIVRAEGVKIWDEKGREYLDCYNNVPAIGHCHPRFVEAVSKQLATLNTHNRYLHEAPIQYLEDLTSSFQAGFDAGLFTCTGSEANDVAIRMAWQITGKRGIIATDHTYHGNTHLVSQLSKKKTPIGNHAPFVRHVPAPDSYRGASGEEFASHIEAEIEALDKAGEGFAALIICPLFANEGFPELDAGWLDKTQNLIKEKTGLLICDEVQSGFGRTGQLWAHERMGVKPDIVTLGKPMASGFPVGGVITYRDYLNRFRKHYGYFNTFGGSPVAAIAAQTTLDIIREENLPDNARKVGAYAKKQLHRLQEKFPSIGDVRGRGLFFGAELVGNRKTKTPDPERAKRIANAMRRKGVLMNRLGIHYNTLKIRPPLVFSMADADTFFTRLEEAFEEDSA